MIAGFLIVATIGLYISMVVAFESFKSKYAIDVVAFEAEPDNEYCDEMIRFANRADLVPTSELLTYIDVNCPEPDFIVEPPKKIFYRGNTVNLSPEDVFLMKLNIEAQVAVLKYMVENGMADADMRSRYAKIIGKEPEQQEERE